MRTLSLQDVVAGLKATGQIFGAEYVKKDGTITKINGRFGVHKFAKGTGVSSPKVLTVWDNNRKRYTAMIPERIVTIKAHKSLFVKHPIVQGQFIQTTEDGAYIDTSR